MRTLKNVFLLVFLLSALSVTTACKKKKTTPKTPQQLVLNTWKVQRALKDNQTAAGDFSTFRVTFSATSYTVQQGTAPVRPTKAANGTWVLESNNTKLVVDKGTANERTINVTTAITEKGFSITWVDDVDKLKPTYQFDLIPAQ